VVLARLALMPGLPGFVEAFVAAILAAHAGLTVRQGVVDWMRWTQDTATAALMAGAAWVAVHLAVRAGGGGVDPALLAALGTYLLLLWPAVNAL
jgi:hypothetical protein